MTHDPKLKIQGQENAYKEVVKKTFNVKIMQEVWRCEGKNVFLQLNSVKRLKGEDYETDISNGRY